MKKLKIKKQHRPLLPLFYNNISYKEMDDSTYSFEIPHSRKYMNYTNINVPHKLISKIIDYSKLD